MRAWVLGVLALLGCYQPPHKACVIRCVPGAKDGCPGELTCGDNGYCSDGEVCTTELAMLRLGARHACALDKAGRVLCWGDNHQSQLGLAGSNETAPRFVTDSASHFVAVAAGGEHSCAIGDDGRALCWGNNADGESAGGRGNAIMTPTPVTIAPSASPPPFERVAAGGAHSCAIGAGQLWCWGAREYVGFTSEMSFMTQVGTRSDWTMVALGVTHSCGIAGSELLCWGDNDYAQAGGAPSNPITTPQPISVSGKVPIYVAAGDLKTCGIYADAAGATTGALYCWGDNYNDKIDPAGPHPITTPTQIGSSTQWSRVSVGSPGICGVDAGQAQCWGYYYGGGGGDGRWQSDRDVTKPVDLGAADDVQLPCVARGKPAVDFACLQQGPQVSCWGVNYYGELGLDVLATAHPDPVAIASPNGQPWRKVVAGESHTCGQTTDGAVWCWGADSDGQISAGVARGGTLNPCIPGVPCDAPTPTAVPAATGLTNPEDLIATVRATCARQGTTLVCWGSPYEGALAMSSSFPAVNVVTAPAAQQWSQLDGGIRAVCGRTTSSTLACWGRLPTSTTATPTIQSDSNLQTITDLRFGDDFACGARTDLSRVCWGRNDSAQLGAGFVGSPITTPTVYTDIAVTLVVASDDTACAITTGGNVACWGNNYASSAGQPENTMMSVPILSPTNIHSGAGDLTGCTDVAIGYEFGCAICGELPWCWGLNSDFELGRGYASVRNPDHNAVQVGVPSGKYTHVVVGARFACALGDAGNLACWGFGIHGEIGDGSHGANYPTPIGTAR